MIATSVNTASAHRRRSGALNLCPVEFIVFLLQMKRAGIDQLFTKREWM
jgi:hypothetical protein